MACLLHQLGREDLGIRCHEVHLILLPPGAFSELGLLLSLYRPVGICGVDRYVGVVDFEAVPSVFLFAMPEVGEHVAHPIRGGQKYELGFISERCHRRLGRCVDLVGSIQEGCLVQHNHGNRRDTTGSSGCSGEEVDGSQALETQFAVGLGCEFDVGVLDARSLSTDPFT